MAHTTPEVGALALPAGTVTFLLTDVEGSTRLWEAAPEEMSAAVARHYELLDAAVALHGGVRPVEQGEGDSVVAAFARAGDALAAGLDAQRALLAEPWPQGAPLRVRMALHTGDARLRDEGNYFGTAVNRCARLRGIAHGGQVLLSRATHDLVQDALPDDAELVDLGAHRLRDLGRPEQVFALVHPDVPPIRAPLRSLDTLPNNLPVEPSSFVGRDRELAQIAEALRTARALTLTGAGGCGKTRLALQAAADTLDRFSGGAWWVALAPLADAALLADAVATAVGVRPLPGQTAADAVVAHLAARRALLVLDNCEHLLAACAELTDALLRGCPDVTVLATSREPLGLPGETSWRVPSLSLPRAPAGETIQSLAQSDAVRLFVERAVQVRPNFAVTNETAPAVAQICHDLDGIPLAIELAAARVRMLAPEQIAAGLADRFRLLTGGARTALPRQQTLRASVDWSHELLDDAERILFRRLGVFAGGFTLDACEEVCADDDLDRYAVLDLLTSLVDKSLVLVEEHGPFTRYRLLETVRHYALDRLLEAGETGALRDRHRDAFVALAERVEPDLLTEREPETLALLDAESANVHAAIEWAAQSDPDLGLRLCSALALWWRLRGLFLAGDAAVKRALDAAPEGTSVLRARALWGRAYINVWAGNTEVVEECTRDALAIGEALDDEWVQGRALHPLSIVLVLSDPGGAERIGTRSRDLARAAGDDFVVADTSQTIGYAHWMRDDYEASRREQAAAYEAAQRLGNREIIAFYWFAEATTPWGSADFERRRQQLERGLAATSEIGDVASAGFGEGFMAHLETLTGDPSAALERLERCHARLLAAGSAMPLSSVETWMAVAQTALGRLDEARATFVDLVEREADGFAWMLAWVHTWLAGVERLRGDGAAAVAQAREAGKVSERVGSAVLLAGARRELARCAATNGDWGEADRLLHEALGAYVEGEHPIFVPDALEALGEVAAGLESHAEAARLLAAGRRARSDLGVARWLPEQAHWDALAQRLREDLGEEAYAAAEAEGLGMAMDEAVAFVRRARGSRKRPAGGWESLTPTELDVVRHAAEGLTNPEIGERMFISRGTVKVHLSHVYAKLGVRNRSELAAEVARREGAGAR